MRIQHNIMAMNAYRNYNTNTSALSSNLEKLSSGYKINRAGDDAAGLAISEKMRAQITGLEAASKNVKDGISLVKTAEGAMQEIQDMLNRMDYLATQSANGTYQDEVDREALQKEVDQLKSEIDRIADSANFNGIKLLDGTWDVDGKEKAISEAQAAVDAASQPVKADLVYNENGLTNKQIQSLMLPQNGTSAGTAGNVGTNTILETDSVDRQKPSFEVNFNGVTHTIGNAAGTYGLTVTVGATAFTISEQDIADYTGKGAGETVTGEELAAVFVNKLGTTAQTISDGTNSYTWDVSQDGEKMVFEFSDSVTTELNEHYDVRLGSSVTAEHVDSTGTEYTTGAVSAGTAGTGSWTVTATVDGVDMEFKLDIDATTVTSVGGIAAALGNAEAELEDGTKVKLSKYFTVAATGTDQIAFTSKEGDTGLTNNVVSGVDVTGGTGISAATGSQTKDGVAGYDVGTVGYLNAGTEVTVMGTPSEPDQLASTTIDLKKLNITDGMKLTLGNQEYTFAVGKDSVVDTSGENVIDLTNWEASDLVISTTATSAQEEAATKLAEAAKGNDVFTVSHEGTDGKVGLKQLAEAKDSTDMTTMEKFASYIKVSTVDTKATAEAQKEAEAQQAADLAAAKEALAEAEGSGAKALNLQIGDTSDDFNQLGVKIGSMKTGALGIADLSISTAEDAAGAIDVIKNAINYVSSVRGDLGAYQNRLEHTANNLSVMTENITDAESTIRDTDIAEEMMAYTKNNILVQSAQAMLAQANAVPQGVLQLLG